MAQLHMFNQWLSALLLSASLLGAATCKAEPPTPSTTPSADAPKPEKPHGMPYAHPSDAEIGTLPSEIGIAVGQPMPNATLSDSTGKQVNLSDLTARGPAVVIFYRGGWCPFCNTQIRDLTEAFPEFQKRGATLVAISVDRQEESTKTSAKYEIPFLILSDPSLTAHRAFNVVYQVGDEEFAKLKGFGLDIEAASGQTHHSIAIPSVFIVDKIGTVQWAHANPDYKTRPSTQQILSALDQAIK